MRGLSHLLQRPSKQYALGLFPTPIHRWNPPGIPEDVEFWIKRDDLTGMQLSGNKVRDFILGSIISVYVCGGNPHPEAVGHSQTCLQPESGASLT